MNAQSMQMLYSSIGAASSTVAGYAQYKQGQAQRAAYDYNANVALDKMKESASASELQFSRLMGRQRSLYAKAGVDISSGSPLLVLADTAMQESEEQERIRRSGQSEYDIQKFYGETAGYAGTMGGMTTFLTGLSRAGTQHQMAKHGVSSPWIQ